MWRRVISSLVLTTLCYVVAAGQAPHTQKKAQKTSPRVREVPPKAGAQRAASSLVADFRSRVIDSVQKNNAYQEIKPIRSPLGGTTWRKTWCTVTDVSISVYASKQLPTDHWAEVTGRTHIDIVRNLPTRESAEGLPRVHREEPVSGGEFQFLYEHQADTWILRRALFRPQINAIPEVQAQLSDIEWQILWDGASAEAAEFEFCLVASHWK